MASSLSFTEVQRFRQWWIWISLAVTLASLILITEQRERNFTGMLSSVIIVILVIILFYITRLNTFIDKEGIRYMLFPFHLNYRKIAWQDLSEAYTRKYSPVLEYGGWGLRIGLFRKGYAVNISGNQGIQLVFKSGKKLLIGTRNQDEAARVIALYFPPQTQN